MQATTDTTNITATQVYHHMTSVVDSAMRTEREGGEDWANVYASIEHAVHALGIERAPGVQDVFVRLAEDAAGSEREGGDDGTRIMDTMTKTQNDLFGLIAIYG